MVVNDTVIFALSASFAYAIADVIARFGLQKSNPLVGAMMALMASVLMFGLVIAFTGVEFPAFGPHYLWMAAGGACNPGLFFIFFFVGISKIGVSRAAPIKGSSAIFAALLAMIFLAEEPAWYNLVGLLLVVGGITVISSGAKVAHWRRIDMLWPIGGAIVAAFAAIFWRVGIQGFPSTVAGTAVAILASLIVVASFTLLTQGAEIKSSVKVAWKFFLIAGTIEGSGKFFYASALQLGEVYRVLPLIQTSPLFVVLISLIVLRSAEHITWRVPAGAILTVGGAILVNARL